MAENKIIIKLRKLMNLKESALEIGNVGEANAAAAGIQRLLTQYNLSAKDIPENEKLDNPIIIEDIPYFHENCKGNWYETLIQVISHHNMCENIVVRESKNGRYRKVKLQIVGRKNNVEIVMYLVSFLSNHFIAQGQKEFFYYCHNMIKQGIKPKNYKMYLRAFLVGCVVGYYKKIESLKEEFDSEKLNEMILISNAEVNKFIRNMNIGTDKSKCSLTFDRNATESGITTGKNVEINKGIYAEYISEDLRLN